MAEETKTHETIQRQYRGALAMLGQAIAQCPEWLWVSAEYQNAFWHIAYHTVFYADFYLQASEAVLPPWPKYRQDSQYLGPREWAPGAKTAIAEPYSKAEVSEFHALALAHVAQLIPPLDLEALSGFSWLAFDKLELQFYNIRHIQHHTGQLIDRLRTKADIGIAWVRGL